jgi:hypothetical protein
MSHFSSIKTKMNNRRALVAALQELGFTVECHDQPIWLRSTYQGNKFSKAHIVIKRETVKQFTPADIEGMSQQQYYQNNPEALETYRDLTIGVDIGFLLNEDGSYSMVADGMYNPVKRLEANINHLYAKHVILQKSEELGHDFAVTEKLNEQGQFVGWQVEVQPQDLQYMGINNTYNSASLLSQY